MKKHGKLFLALAIIFTFVFGVWAGVRIVKAVSFSLECGAYLKRAADANTVEIALEELEKVIEYADKNALKDGVVSVFLKDPKNDLKFWYQNMTAAYDEMNVLLESDTTTALEKTNVLMKLRESLTDRSSGDTKVVHPAGISVYPNNAPYFWWSLISGAGMCAFWVLSGVSFAKIQVVKKVIAKKK